MKIEECLALCYLLGKSYLKFVLFLSVDKIVNSYKYDRKKEA